MNVKHSVNIGSILFATLLSVSLLLQACAQTNDDGSDDPYAHATQPRTAVRMGEIIMRIDADRMRVLIPIEGTDDLSKDELLRLMQANFDSALDARYAIAQGQLWAAFIHPLSSLTDEEFLLGIGQTANVVASFGSTYSSGMFIFGGGDSAEIERKRFLEELRNQST